MATILEAIGKNEEAIQSISIYFASVGATNEQKHEPSDQQK